MNHTPGPLKAQYLPEYPDDRFPGRWEITDGRRSLAILTEVFTREGNQEIAANAAIFAAAPDILAALEAVIEVAQHEGTTDNHEIISLARTAIAQATAAPAVKDTDNG